jgi:hypothetical protein
MPTTCPRCGTRSPSSDRCTGCGRELYRVALPALEPGSSTPSRLNNFRMTRVWTWTTMGFVLLLVGTGASTGLLLDGSDRNEPTEERVSQDKVPGPAISLEPPSSDKPSTKSVKKDKKAEPSPSKSDSAPGKPSGGSPSNGLPAAFQTLTDPMGFSLSVRKGWARTAITQNLAQYAPGTGLEVLRVGAMPGAQNSSYNNLAAAEQQIASNDATYQRIALVENTFAGRPGARWEFTWTDANTGEVMHAREQAYVAADGTEYSIYFETRNSLWNAQRELTFNTALNTWQVNGPAPAPAPASSAPAPTDSGSNSAAAPRDSAYAQRQNATINNGD